MSVKVTEFRKSAKAWVGAAVAALTGLSAFIVPESTVGVLLASAVGFLVALGGVFATENKPETPEAPKWVNEGF